MTVKQQFRRRAAREFALGAAVYVAVAFGTGSILIALGVLIVLDMTLTGIRRSDRRQAEEEERGRRLALRQAAERDIRARHGEFN